MILWFYATIHIPIAEVTAIGYSIPLYVTIRAVSFFWGAFKTIPSTCARFWVYEGNVNYWTWFSGSFSKTNDTIACLSNVCSLLPDSKTHFSQRKFNGDCRYTTLACICCTNANGTSNIGNPEFFRSYLSRVSSHFGN